jgi:WS/DGAT/MGAT family acyltransferase
MATTGYERLSVQDSSFVIFEGPGTHMHVSAVSLFDLGPLAGSDGRLDIDRLRAYVASRLHILPTYRQRLDFTPVTRHPIWVDDAHFNLLYHVRHTALPGPGNERQLKDLAGRIMSQQLDRKKPLWEIWFIEGLRKRRFAMIGKIHHCMVDGATGVSVMTALLSASRDETFDDSPRFVPRPAPSRLTLISDEVTRRAATPVAALRAVRDALQQPERTRASITASAESVWQAIGAGFRVPANTPLNRPIGTHRRIDWRSISLARVKDMKNKLDGTVNDAVLAIVTGALRRFLRSRHVDVEGLDFRVVVPVNMRRGEGDPRYGNRVSALFVSLPIGESDPVAQFERIKEETQRLKDSRVAQGVDLLMDLAEWSRSDLLTYWGVRLVSSIRPYNMIVTNVPGPQQPLYLLGARLEATYPQLPLFENQGLGVAVMSYLGKINFGLVADWDLVPDLARFARSIDASVAALEEAVEKR